MQQAQKAAAEAKAQSHRGFRLEGEGGVVELQFFQGVPQVRIVGAVRRIDAAEHHRLHRPVSSQRLSCGTVRQGNGVAHSGVAHILDRGGDIAYLSGIQRLSGLQ